MVGASGAVFGLAGGWWVADLRAGAPGLRRALRAAGLVLAAAIGNVLMDAFTPGGIAWQTHLGGALAGAALALCWRR
jgi:membrane associated rhomboid family serine protease